MCQKYVLDSICICCIIVITSPGCVIQFVLPALVLASGCPRPPFLPSCRNAKANPPTRRRLHLLSSSLAGTVTSLVLRQNSRSQFHLSKVCHLLFYISSLFYILPKLIHPHTRWTDVIANLDQINLEFQEGSASLRLLSFEAQLNLLSRLLPV